MKPGIPKGTRDFHPRESVRRKYLFGVIEKVFRRYGYQPIETPAMENLSTLSGKYGEEGERLLFKVLNNGDFLSKADEQALDARDSNGLVPSISKRGLRYDLTVPFARYVVMHRNEIQLPFKRYQIQPVWRADRPQKGRYQEFYQCDVDVVGSDSLMYEAEFVQIYDEVFSNLGIPVNIRLNHRMILAGIAETAGIPDQLTQMTIAVDKWDKIGEDGVSEELAARGIPEPAVVRIIDLLKNSELEALEKLLESSPSGRQGTAEVREVMSFLDDIDLRNKCTFDIKLARGLDYYTGCIYEVETPLFSSGSIGGGGRYSDLTGVFGMKNLPGVGISFGAERIYDALENAGLFPDDLSCTPDIILLPLDHEALKFAFRTAAYLRNKGVRADTYPTPAKMQKQMKYADALGVPYVGIVGEREVEDGSIALKNMATGEQETTSPDQAARICSAHRK